MNNDQFDAVQRSREWFHGLRLLPGAWTIIRVDGRSFSRFTEKNYEKPFDERFSACMVETATALMRELDGVYAYTESDEISLLLPPRWNLFDRSVEKIVSISAGIASSTFALASGEPVHFDSRVWLGTSAFDVADYFSWRQSDAARCAINGWCYWTLRKEGYSKRKATSRLERASTSDKNEILFEFGLNFNEMPLWQRRGIGLLWETYMKEGRNPLTDETVQVPRRRLSVERELPMKNEYRDMLLRMCSER